VVGRDRPLLTQLRRIRPLRKGAKLRIGVDRYDHGKTCGLRDVAPKRRDVSL
jgi:hypothetical protein